MIGSSAYSFPAEYRQIEFDVRTCQEVSTSFANVDKRLNINFAHIKTPTSIALPKWTCFGQLRQSHGTTPSLQTCVSVPLCFNQAEAGSDTDPRTIAASALTLSSLLYSGIIPAKWIIFWPPWLFKLFPEVWRLVTPFIITGPQLGLLLDPYFLYTYGSALERGSPRFSHPGDFITYLGFVCAVIIVSLPFVPPFVCRRLCAIAFTSYICPRCSYCSDGSWKRGRLPSHSARTHHSQSVGPG